MRYFSLAFSDLFAVPRTTLVCVVCVYIYTHNHEAENEMASVIHFSRPAKRNKEKSNADGYG